MSNHHALLHNQCDSHTMFIYTANFYTHACNFGDSTITTSSSTVDTISFSGIDGVILTEHILTGAVLHIHIHYNNKRHSHIRTHMHGAQNFRQATINAYIYRYTNTTRHIIYPTNKITSSCTLPHEL